jgi:hypothetical protein
MTASPSSASHAPLILLAPLRIDDMVAEADYLTGLVERLGAAPSAGDVTDALVPELADLAQVFLRRGDEIHLVAYRHIDEAHHAILAELARVHRPRVDHPADPVAQVMRTGEARLVTWLRRQNVERATSDTRVHAVFDAIQPRCIVIVPLERQGERYGAIVVAMSSTSRRFIEGDLDFMSDLARRVGPRLVEDAPESP